MTKKQRDYAELYVYTVCVIMRTAMFEISKITDFHHAQYQLYGTFSSELLICNKDVTR